MEINDNNHIDGIIDDIFLHVENSSEVSNQTEIVSAAGIHGLRNYSSYDLVSDNIDELSTTLRDIDSTLKENEVGRNSRSELVEKIYCKAPVKYFQDLLAKQRESHDRIKNVQECIQQNQWKNDFADDLIDNGDLLYGTPSDTEWSGSDVSLKPFLHSSATERNEPKDHQSSGTINNQSSETMNSADNQRKGRSSLTSLDADSVSSQALSLPSYNDFPSAVHSEEESDVETDLLMVEHLDKNFYDNSPEHPLISYQVLNQHDILDDASLRQAREMSGTTKVYSEDIVSPSGGTYRFPLSTNTCHESCDYKPFASPIISTNQCQLSSNSTNQLENFRLENMLEKANFAQDNKVRSQHLPTENEAMLKNEIRIKRYGYERRHNDVVNNNTTVPCDNDELLLYLDLINLTTHQKKLEYKNRYLSETCSIQQKLETLFGEVGMELIPGSILKSFSDILQQELEECTGEVKRKYKNKKSEYKVYNDRLTKSIETLSNDNSKLNTELQVVKHKLADFETLKNGADKNEERVTYLEALLTSVEKENDKMKLDLKTLQQGEEEYCDENKKLHNVNEALKMENEKLLLNNESLKTRLKNENENLVQQHHSSNLDLINVRNENVVLNEKIKMLNTSKDTDLQIIRHLEEKIKEFEVSTKMNRCEIEESKLHQQNIEKELNACKAELHRSNSVIKSREHDLVGIQEKYSLLQSEYADNKTLNHEVTSRRQAEVVQLNKIIDDLRTENKQLNTLRRTFMLPEKLSEIINDKNVNVEDVSMIGAAVGNGETPEECSTVTQLYDAPKSINTPNKFSTAFDVSSLDEICNDPNIRRKDETCNDTDIRRSSKTPHRDGALQNSKHLHNKITTSFINNLTELERIGVKLEGLTTLHQPLTASTTNHLKDIPVSYIKYPRVKVQAIGFDNESYDYTQARDMSDFKPLNNGDHSSSRSLEPECSFPGKPKPVIQNQISISDGLNNGFPISNDKVMLNNLSTKTYFKNKSTKNNVTNVSSGLSNATSYNHGYYSNIPNSNRTVNPSSSESKNALHNTNKSEIIQSNSYSEGYLYHASSYDVNHMKKNSTRYQRVKEDIPRAQRAKEDFSRAQRVKEDIPRAQRVKEDFSRALRVKEHQYSFEDTRSFLTEMKYKLEHTEKALKLADG